MTEAEMRAVADRLALIVRLKHDLANERSELAFVNKHAAAGKTYKVYVQLKKEQFYNEKTDVVIQLDAGIVQQHFINRISALQREIIRQGGTP